MAATDHLGPQFFDHEALGGLKASDYKGTVADGVGAMDHWQSLFGGTTEARHYAEGDSPAQTVERLRADIRQNGVQKPITVLDHGSHVSIKDGHHRAVAAHLEGQGAPVNLMSADDYYRGLWRNR